MPVMGAGDSGAVCVSLLVAGSALKRWNAFTGRAAYYIGEMPVPVIALLRVVRSRMAVDAARMRQY